MIKALTKTKKKGLILEKRKENHCITNRNSFSTKLFSLKEFFQQFSRQILSLRGMYRVDI